MSEPESTEFEAIVGEGFTNVERMSLEVTAEEGEVAQTVAKIRKLIRADPDAANRASHDTRAVQVASRDVLDHLIEHMRQQQKQVFELAHGQLADRHYQRALGARVDRLAQAVELLAQVVERQEKRRRGGSFVHDNSPEPEEGEG